MENDGISDNREVWISYVNDDNTVISGYVRLIEQTSQYIKFRTNHNIITISYNRLLKLKEKQ